jgi:hypothetical protein
VARGPAARVDDRIHKDQDRYFRRLSSLPARSDAAVDVLLESSLLGWSALALDSEERNLQLCSTQMLEVWPGAPAQRLHADEANWPKFLTGPYTRELQCCSGEVDFRDF